jgi:subtilase family protein
LPRHPHIILPTQAVTERYTATRSRGVEFRTPPRNRATHAAQVLRSFQQAQGAREQFPQQIGAGFYESPGLTLTFESDPGFPLAFESLDLQKSKIQLLAVTSDEQDRTFATIHVPDDKIQILLRKLEAYRDFDPARGGQENRRLVESIANIKLATLHELWTDETGLYPAANTIITWEVWLRRLVLGERPTLETLANAAPDFGFEIASNALTFVDREVVLVRGSREQLSRGVDILGIIAEVRKAKITADFFSSLSPAEQFEWSDDLLRRVTNPAANAPAIGLLDTGVNRAHPLLSRIIADADTQSLKPQWGVQDSHPDGHGTQMAGLSIYGDLAPILSDNNPVVLTHGLQSLKLIHQADPHRPELYGTATIEGISRLEIDTSRRRNYCMAITADARDRGKPSSWSAAIDNLACGAINDTHRLIIVSAGNIGLQERADYPAYNETASVQDPSQAWNALTVGGYTDKVFINQEENPGWLPLATQGDLAPASTTSMTWPRSLKTPFKPDIVMEAGNMGKPPNNQAPDFLDELQLLTTNHRFAVGQRPFVTFQDTSAAAALAANLSTRLLARYPAFTPETLRGLMVHSAHWTDAMISRATDSQGRLDTVRLLRTFGYGTPNTERLFYSADNNLTLIAQDSLQPYFKDEDRGGIKTKDIKYHALPWPREALLDLPLNTEVQMRVTLSYFIEPSPGERGWDRKYGYASHGLRFKVIRATETLDEFKLRINAHGREDDYDEDHVGETGTWDFGVAGPTNGSIHSNTWHGTAAELARRGYIAIHPTLGWWRTRPTEQRYDQTVQYSLIVTISTPSEVVDIYTPVANQIGIEIPIGV